MSATTISDWLMVNSKVRPGSLLLSSAGWLRRGVRFIVEDGVGVR